MYIEDLGDKECVFWRKKKRNAMMIGLRDIDGDGI